MHRSCTDVARRGDHQNLAGFVESHAGLVSGVLTLTTGNQCFTRRSDEGEEYAQRLGGFGVDVHGLAHPGQIHNFYCMPRMIPYALEFMRIVGQEIRYAVGLPPPERRSHRRIRPELIRA